MLQSIRDRSQGWLAWIVVSIICATFALWGIHSYLSNVGTSDVVATVNGEDIHQAQVMTSYERMRQQRQIQLGADFALDQTAESQLKKKALGDLIMARVLSKAALQSGFRVSPEQVKAMLLNVPAFQVEGRFSRERFKEIINNLQYNQDSFLADLRTTMLINQVHGGIANSEFILPEDVSNAIRLINQKRDISYLVVPVNKFIASAEVGDSDAKTYYQQHASDFKTPEQVSIDYIQLSIADLAKQIHFDDNELQKYYQDNLVNFSTPEQWHLAQILVTVPPDANAKQAQDAKAKVNLIKQQLQKGMDFALLAKQYSDDRASASKGGEVAWFNRGSQDPQFEKMISPLKNPGQVIGPIAGANGFGFYKLLGLKKAEVMSFAQAKPLVEKALTKQKAEQLFNEMNDKLSNLTYANPNTLDVAAQALNLPIQHSDLFTHQGGKDKITTNPRIVAVAFGPEVLDQGNNSDVLEVDTNTVMVLRVKQHKPASLLPFAEVQETIKQRLQYQAAIAKAKALGEEIVRALNESTTTPTLLTKNGLSWKTITNAGRFDSRLDSPLLTQAFHMPRPNGNKPLTSGLPLANGDYAVISIKAIHDGEITNFPASQLRIYGEQLQNSLGEFDYALYARGMLDKAKITWSGAYKDNK